MGQIKNVVFDMGGVLMKYEPIVFARPHVDSDEDARLVAAEVFGGREWPLQDAGVVDAETIGWTAATRLPARLGEAAMQTALHWFDEREYYDGADTAIRELKARGYGIYLLSNAGVQFDQYKETLPAWECFDGAVVSAFVHLMKPDPRIFSLLADTYGLACDECLFVDDVEINVEGARRAGMHGLVYTGEMGDVFAALGEKSPA
jgi:putative hydrolase of the HAD superfamily